MSATRTLPVADLEALIARAIVRAGASEANAASVARALTQAEIDGQPGHGFWRVPSYAAKVRAGKVDGHAVPKAERTRTASLMIDAADGFAYPALDLAVATLPTLAAEAGIAGAGIFRSSHAGALGLTVERLADRGLLTFAFANTPSAMAAWGGKRGVFGTNPLAFAAPRPGRPSVVIDLALAQVARAKIMAAAQKGEPIPLGWAVDADGRPTTDAKAASKGLSLPLGGPKGAALALMVEVMAAALVGAKLASETSSFLDDKGGPNRVGQFLIAIDPAAFGGAEVFAERFEMLATAIEDDAGARLPGTRRLALRATAAKEGVTVDAKLMSDVEQIASR